LFLYDIYGEYELRHWMALPAVPIFLVFAITIMPNFRVEIGESGLTARAAVKFLGRTLFIMPTYTTTWADIVQVREGTLPKTFVIEARRTKGLQSLTLNSFFTNLDQAMCFICERVPHSRLSNDVRRYVDRRCGDIV
jgi:hypothetical protein